MILARRIFLCMWISFLFGAVSAQELTIYCEENSPLQHFDSQKKKLVGLHVEVVQEIQKRLGTNFPIQLVPWSQGLQALDNKSNVLLFTMARTPAREKLYQWIGPLSPIAYGLYVKADSPIKIESLEEARKIGWIGVYHNSIIDITITRLGFSNLDRDYSNSSTFKKLMTGRITAFAASKMSVETMAKETGYQASDVKLAFHLFNSELFIAASKTTDTKLVKKWNATLEAMKKDNSFQRIQKKYLDE